MVDMGECYCKFKLMRKNMLGLAGILMAAEAMRHNSGMLTQEDVKRITSKKVPVIQPKGTKEYFFNAQGEFSTTRMLKSETVFTCFAINDKNAVRKFKNRI